MPNAKSRDIKLQRLLNENLIELNLQEKNKEKLISKLVGLLAKSGKLKNKKSFLRAILEREKMGSTGIGNGVAIPHAKSKAVKGPVLAFARSEEGLDFGALDGEKVYLFFMLVSPEALIGEHLKILAKISYLIKDKFTLEALRGARTKKDVLKIISSFEKQK